ncbi:MAG: helix-turn-helix transcriptional regulator [Mycobacterium sp.]
MTAPMQRPTSTGTDAGGIKDYTVPPIGTRARSLQVDDLRTRYDLVGGKVQDLHGEVREQDLRQRTLNKGRFGVPALLEELACQRGMSWTDIADVAEVSVSAVRKWRKGGDALPDVRRRLAKFAALLDTLEEKGVIQDPSNWMEMDLPLAAGYYIRPIDLYLNGHDMALLDIAEQRRPVEHILDDIRPDWRDTRSKFEVFEDTDGMRSIRIRGE